MIANIKDIIEIKSEYKGNPRPGVVIVLDADPKLLVGNKLAGLQVAIDYHDGKVHEYQIQETRDHLKAISFFIPDINSEALEGACQVRF